jgi:alkanesulfonate monooxygenase SsuD/methylene tetrahydromethanopterin reductase-like flavin-dependent oxidoreductase (luciferase family)
VEGRFLEAADAAALRAHATGAALQGADAVFVTESAFGDPIVLAAGLSSWVPDLLLGVRITLDPDGRHPAVLARDVAGLDLVSGGRSVLCFAPPFVDALPEAVALCRALWRPGELVSEGPRFPVRAAANRVRPRVEGSPLVAFDLTGGEQAPASVLAAADMVLLPSSDASDVCRLERV